MSMDEKDTALVAIDAASSDSQSWPESLERIAQYLDCAFAALIFEDRSASLLELKYSSGTQRSWLTEYLRSHRKLDAARATLIDSIGVGRVFSAGDFLQPERFYQSMLFQRWLEPHNLIDILGAVLHRSDRGTCLFVAFRSMAAGPVNGEAKARLAAILPQLIDALRRDGRTALESAVDSQLPQLFEQLVAPIIVVDSQLRVRKCNESARDMLKAHPTLALSKGALVIGDADARESLEKAFRKERPTGARRCALLLRNGDEKCCVMHVLLLSHGEAAIIVRSLASRADIGGDVIADIYGLTARETSVLLAIVDVGGVPAAAHALRLSEGTVKSYLKSIFQKTGAQRQADLVKLVIALESPFNAPQLAV